MGNPIVHCEIPTKDLGKGVEFYSKLFGWQCTQWGEQYSMFAREEGGIGGGLMLDDKPDAQVMLYIMVDDIEAKLAEIVKAGGKLVTPKTQISPEIGYFGVFTDPSGVPMGLFTPSMQPR